MRGACTGLRGRRPTLKRKLKKKKIWPLQKSANRSGLCLCVLGRWPKRLPSPPPGTRGMGRARNGGTRRQRRLFLNATVAHSWPLQLLEMRGSFLPFFPLPPPFVFLPGMELSTLAVQKTFHSHDKNRTGDVGIP